MTTVLDANVHNIAVRGTFDDAQSIVKALFNDLSTRMVNEELNPPCAVALVFDPTSNLFSVAVSVLVPTGSEELFNEWLTEEGHTINDLQHSLS
jgi:threonine synthase